MWLVIKVEFKKKNKKNRGIIGLRQKIDMEIHRTTLHSFLSPTAPSQCPAHHLTSRTLRRVVHSVAMFPTIAQVSQHHSIANVCTFFILIRRSYSFPVLCPSPMPKSIRSESGCSGMEVGQRQQNLAAEPGCLQNARLEAC